MDIPKYIGLFLLKNRFCYIHGLGNLEIKKKPANFDGQTLKPAPYEVQITAAGSIDDNLANFIATNEQTSISKASNALREFSTQARTALAEGKEVVIPFIGKFVEHDHKVAFITDPHLQYTPPGLPTLKQTRTPEDEIPAAGVANTGQPREENISFHNDEPQLGSGASINWGRIGIIAAILIVMVAGLIFGIRLISHQNADAQRENVIKKDSVVKPAPLSAAAMDSIRKAKMMDSLITYRMVVGSFKTYQLADKKMKRYLATDSTYKLQVVTKDSANFYLVMPVAAKYADTTLKMDSLKGALGLPTISIYQ